MSDFSVSIKLRNARIRRRVAECGFRNINELCRKSGLYPSAVGALLNLKVPPLTRAGTWRRSAVALADVLGCTCEELFSVTQRTLALSTNEGECTVTEGELLKLCYRFERPLIENPEERLLEDSDEHTKVAVVRRALDALKLTARNRKIIESYFGIDCEERTLNDLALELKVSRSAIENSLTRTLQRLGRRDTNSHRLLLQAYQPASAMAKADEARIQNAQPRASLLRSERQYESRITAQRATAAHARPSPGISGASAISHRDSQPALDSQVRRSA